MHCDACDERLVVFDVPEGLRKYAPDGGETGTATLCPNCLAVGPVAEQTVESADGRSVESPDGQPVDSIDGRASDSASFSRVSDALPADRDAAVSVALLVGLLDSLALNRERIEELVDELEHGGTDVFLVLDRLAADSDVDAAVDLDRRRTQLEQLLY